MANLAVNGPQVEESVSCSLAEPQAYELDLRNVRVRLQHLCVHIEGSDQTERGVAKRRFKKRPPGDLLHMNLKYFRALDRQNQEIECAAIDYEARRAVTSIAAQRRIRIAVHYLATQSVLASESVSFDLVQDILRDTNGTSRDVSEYSVRTPPSAD